MDDYQFLGFLNLLDLVLIGILVASVILGIFRGLVREVLALVSWVLSIWIAWKYGNTLGEYLMTWLNSERLSHYAGLGLIFIGSLFAFTVISKMVHNQFRITGLTLMNRLFGAIFGLIRGLVLSSLLLFASGFSPAIETKWYKQSELVPYISPLVTFIDDAMAKRAWDKE